jgi:Transcriptional regulators
MEIDKVDLDILKELQKDSRLSIRELSKKVNLSPPSVAERVRRLEDNDIIEGYTIKINKSKLGITIRCVMQVTMRNGEYNRFIKYISDHPRSELCYRVAGEACFIVVLSVVSLDEIEEFINDVSSFAITKTMIAFKQVAVDENIGKFLNMKTPDSSK